MPAHVISEVNSLKSMKNPAAQLFILVVFCLSNISQTMGWEPPPLEKLTASPGLPDLFTFADGSKVADVKDWQSRREEMKAMIQYYQYGSIPPRPDSVSVFSSIVKRHKSEKGEEHWITLSIDSKHQLKMRMVLYLPDKGSSPFPVVIREEGTLGRTEAIPMFLENGYAFIEYARHDLDPDKKDTVGPAQKAYSDYDWATLAVWAWGGMRVLDYLESRSDIDMKRVAITGHSRGGKMALLAGALDERFTMVVPNGSGAGGAGASRILGPGAESIGMNDKPHWYSERIQWFGGREDKLPIDQHFLKALVAPRILLCTESLDDLFANPWGTQVTSMAARDVYKFLDAPLSRNGLVYRRGKHDSNMDDWKALLDFAKWHFDNVYPNNRSRFWTTPMLVPKVLLGYQHNPNTFKSQSGKKLPAVNKINITFSTIGQPNNGFDENHFGLGEFGNVDEIFDIAIEKITIKQYTQFLNAVAREDKFELYHPEMTSIGLAMELRDGLAYYYCARSCEEKPVRYVDYHSALRFCNWLHHKQPIGDQDIHTTEDGAYKIDGQTVEKRPDAVYSLPSEDQWYKAAYFDPQQGYQLFTEERNPHTVGRNGDGISPFGIKGMNDGVWEWNDARIGGLFRGLRSGAWFQGNNRQAAGRMFTNPQARLDNIGFRVCRKTK